MSLSDTKAAQELDARDLPAGFDAVVDYILRQAHGHEALHLALDGLLTANEQQELVHRLQIFELLEQGLAQREIAKRVGVGIATVSRGSKAFQEGKFVSHASM